MSTHHEPRSAPRSTDGPSLNAVHEDPSVLARVPVRVIVRLRCQVSHLAAELDAALFTALAQPGPDAAPQSPDRLLTPAAAAERFGVTRRWLLAHSGRWSSPTRASDAERPWPEATRSIRNSTRLARRACDSWRPPESPRRPGAGPEA